MKDNIFIFLQSTDIFLLECNLIIKNDAYYHVVIPFKDICRVLSLVKKNASALTAGKD